MDPEHSIKVLKCRDRRVAIKVMAYHSGDEEMQLDTLFDAINARIPQVQSVRSQQKNRERVACRFHHIHTPVLEEMGIVEVDEDEGVVRWEREPVMRLSEALDRLWDAENALFDAMGWTPQ